MMIRRGSGTISSFTNNDGEEVSNIRTGEGKIEELVDVKNNPLEHPVDTPSSTPIDKQQ